MILLLPRLSPLDGPRGSARLSPSVVAVSLRSSPRGSRLRRGSRRSRRSCGGLDRVLAQTPPAWALALGQRPAAPGARSADVLARERRTHHTRHRPARRRPCKWFSMTHPRHVSAGVARSNGAVTEPDLAAWGRARQRPVRVAPKGAPPCSPRGSRRETQRTIEMSPHLVSIDPDREGPKDRQVLTRQPTSASEARRSSI